LNKIIKIYLVENKLPGSSGARAHSQSQQQWNRRAAPTAKQLYSRLEFYQKAHGHFSHREPPQETLLLHKPSTGFQPSYTGYLLRSYSTACNSINEVIEID
jgi:hypothetical protein